MNLCLRNWELRFDYFRNRFWIFALLPVGIASPSISFRSRSTIFIFPSVIENWDLRFDCFTESFLTSKLVPKSTIHILHFVSLCIGTCGSIPTWSKIKSLKHKICLRLFIPCPSGRNRTYDRLLKRELLYRLSYKGIYINSKDRKTAIIKLSHLRFLVNFRKLCTRVPLEILQGEIKNTRIYKHTHGHR